MSPANSREVLMDPIEESHVEDNENKFIDALKTPNFNSYQYTLVRDQFRKPRTVEVITHLKLFKAFRVLKKRVLGETDQDTEHEDATKLKTWQVFMTMSIRRFIIFINALYSKIKDEPTEKSRYVAFNQIMDSLIPPLDVLMVWHSLSLNSAFFHDVMTRSEFTEFLGYPFPWSAINEAVHNYSFEYLPSWNLQKNYISVLRDAGYETDGFHLDSMDTLLVVDVYCPSCSRLLAEGVDMSNSQNTGFADYGFSTKIGKKQTECKCSGLSDISHDVLRKLQLCKDIDDEKPLVGCVERNLLSSRDLSSLRDVLKYLLTNHPEYTVVQIAQEAFKRVKDPVSERVFAKNYVFLNLIHCTVSHATIQVHRDLVTAIVRQEQFMHDILKVRLLHDSEIVDTIKQSMVKYTNFISMHSEDKNVLLYPTLEIDMILKTTQLSNPATINVFYQRTSHMFIQESDLEVAFPETLAKYSKKFEHYAVTCGCALCQALKKPHRVKVDSFWKKTIGVIRGNKGTTGEGEQTIIRPISLTHPSLNYCWFSRNSFSTNYEDGFIKEHIIYSGVCVNSPFVSPIEIEK
ncbi:hypothetical protein Cantr_02857 [Candida viswanathii]|uniref:Uncharacterized protein n=1 Tax=Candida viswanathii TaxID=5486 RepID=A0A367YP87_9ASCO|nr:hypothetical protein Cantr_02857 [Candida viswanathii]